MGCLKYFLGVTLLISYLSHGNLKANECGSCFDGVCIGAEFLYWQPCLSNNDVALVFDSDPLESSGRFEFIPNDWEPGVRVYLGKDNFWCGWNIWASYTYLKTNGSKDLTPPPNGALISDFLFGNAGNDIALFAYSFVDFIHQRQTIEYQTYEILFSHWKFETCYCLTLMPYFGVEGLLLDQTLEFATASGANTLNADITLDYHGVGLKTGLDFHFPLWKCFSFIVNTSLSMTYGNKKWELTGIGQTNDTSATPLNQNIKAKECVFIPGFDIKLGLNFATCRCGKEIGVIAGWEYLQKHNVPQINRYGTIDDTLTLGFQGLFAGGYVKF